MQWRRAERYRRGVDRPNSRCISETDVIWTTGRLLLVLVALSPDHGGGALSASETGMSTVVWYDTQG
jgi:hypothetical protein